MAVRHCLVCTTSPLDEIVHREIYIRTPVRMVDDGKEIKYIVTIDFTSDIYSYIRTFMGMEITIKLTRDLKDVGEMFLPVAHATTMFITLTGEKIPYSDVVIGWETSHDESLIASINKAIRLSGLRPISIERIMAWK